MKVIKTELPKKKVVMSTSLSELHALRLRLEGAEGTLSQHVHICFGDDGVHDCGLKITQLEVNAQTPEFMSFTSHLSSGEDLQVLFLVSCMIISVSRFGLFVCSRSFWTSTPCVRSTCV